MLGKRAKLLNFWVEIPALRQPNEVLMLKRSCESKKQNLFIVDQRESRCYDDTFKHNWQFSVRY